MVFRGPMEIYNIAVFYPPVLANTRAWRRVSSYRRGYPSENLVFLNNLNVDYSGQARWGPQSFASADGKAMARNRTEFKGSLADASDPSQLFGGPGVSTGVEVNVMTRQPCRNGDCGGRYNGSYNYHGWRGGRKVIVTRVSMPMSSAGPNLPAIWMLNAQVMYTGQYSCNCRGQGRVGGCGELDIAEVIANNNEKKDRVSTHYYFYNGSVENPPNGDNYAPRPTTRNATYVTIIDDSVGEGSNRGLIKVIQIDCFNFQLQHLHPMFIQRWIDYPSACKVV